MNVVWKYKIVEGPNTIELPKGTQPLSVQVQKGEPCLWCLVDNEEIEMEVHLFWLVGTGYPIKYGHPIFIGTVQFWAGDIIMHLFEIKEK